MIRSLRWQLSAIAAAAAGVICVAQAQSADPAIQAEPTAAAEAMALPDATPEPAATEADVQATMQREAEARSTDPSAAAEPAAPGRTAPYTAGAPAAAQAQAQTSTIVVVPTQVDQNAIAEKAWAAVEAEQITREEVAAEAAYANKNGLIARGELSIVGEDKGTAYVEQADQARHARATQQYMAKVDARHQQFAAAEQERLNQLALAEQQRQQALAAEQAAQQQQLAQQEQPTQ